MRRVAKTAILCALSGISDLVASEMVPGVGRTDEAPSAVQIPVLFEGLASVLPGWRQRRQDGLWLIATPQGGEHLARWQAGDLALATAMANLGAVVHPFLPGFVPVVHLPMDLGEGLACRVIGRCGARGADAPVTSGTAVLFRQRGSLQVLATRGQAADLAIRHRDLQVATTLV